MLPRRAAGGVVVPAAGLIGEDLHPADGFRSPTVLVESDEKNDDQGKKE
jgi:hypothetical protein